MMVAHRSFVEEKFYKRKGVKSQWRSQCSWVVLCLWAIAGSASGALHVLEPLRQILNSL